MGRGEGDIKREKWRGWRREVLIATRLQREQAKPHVPGATNSWKRQPIGRKAHRAPENRTKHIDKMSIPGPLSAPASANYTKVSADVKD